MNTANALSSFGIRYFRYYADVMDVMSLIRHPHSIAFSLSISIFTTITKGRRARRDRDRKSGTSGTSRTRLRHDPLRTTPQHPFAPTTLSPLSCPLPSSGVGSYGLTSPETLCSRSAPTGYSIPRGGVSAVAATAFGTLCPDCTPAGGIA